MKKKVLALLTCFTLSAGMIGCGNIATSPSDSNPNESTVNNSTTNSTETKATTEEKTTTTKEETTTTKEETSKPSTEPETSKIQPKEITIGDTISLDFVEMTFKETGIEEDIQQTFTRKSKVVTSTHISGPQPEEGNQFVYLRGTIKNLNSKELPVYDFFEGLITLDEYDYNITANECDIITTEGKSVSEIEPLKTYTFTIYTSVPNELAENHTSSTFTFGFYDLFDNKTLSYNRAFLDNAIAECPYQYTIILE